MPDLGFVDGSCTACGNAVRWFGRMVDRPKCGHCGFEHTKAELEETDRLLDEEAARQTPERREFGDNVRQARQARGVSLVQAARRCGMRISAYSGVEAGYEDFTPEQSMAFARMCEEIEVEK